MTKFFIWLIFLVGLLGGLIIGVGFYLSPQGVLKTSDAIVVISGGETDLRVKEGVRLYQADWAPLMIMSGAARDEGESNAEAMKRLAISYGVPSDKILVEKEARDTFDNAKFTHDLLEEHQIRSIILVTSPYHQRRAYLTFRYYLGPDVTIINHSAADSAWRKNGWWNNAWARSITFSELQKLTYLAVFFKGETKTSILDGTN
ncbi:MAG: YdcF family protein [Patescibacteria group bacterium]|jgi:uncharacterized SAM-binding protein YcdF (DUF218 family)